MTIKTFINRLEKLEQELRKDIDTITFADGREIEIKSIELLDLMRELLLSDRQGREPEHTLYPDIKEMQSYKSEGSLPDLVKTIAESIEMHKNNK